MPDHVRPSDRKGYAKRSLIFTEKAKNRFKTHNRDKSIVYQNWNVQKLGFAWAYYTLDMAIEHARIEFRTMYGTNISPRRWRIIMAIQSLCAMGDGSFTILSLESYLRDKLYGVRTDAKAKKSVARAIIGLCKIHFINPLGHGLYSPTNRMKIFIQMIDKHYKSIIELKKY